MLNLLVALMKLRIFLPLLLFLLAAQDAPLLALTSPRPGDTLRGTITITGTTDIPNFLAAQLDFTYASDSTATWFPLQSFSQPQPESALYTWDTTTITDGDYTLRLQATLTDGTTKEVTVPVTIQNDALPATPTPAATSTPLLPDLQLQIPTPFLLAASPTPTDLPRPTPTPLPGNPIALTQTEIMLSLGRGVLVIIGLFVFAGILLRLRRS